MNLLGPELVRDLVSLIQEAEGDNGSGGGSGDLAIGSLREEAVR